MLEADSIVGEISDPNGTLKVGKLGDTECAFLAYRSNKDGKNFHLVYTSRELSVLLAAVKKGRDLAKTAKPRSTIRLSALPAKPVRLQLVLVCPEGKEPVLILRFLGVGWKQDVVSPPATFLEVLQKAERRAPMPGIVGILDRFGSKAWMIEGQTLTVKDKYSHGTGFYREYIHHSEVPDGTVVRAWPHKVGDELVVLAFEYAQTFEPEGSIDLPQGQKGDDALFDGLVRESRELHAVLSKAMYESGQIDPVWSGKVTLTSVLGDILMSDHKAGLSTWQGNGGNPILKAGKAHITEGKLSPHDTALSHMITAYYATKSDNAAAATQTINQSMLEAWNYALYNDPNLQRTVLINWFLHLRQVNKGATNGPPFAAWEEKRTDYDHELKPAVVCLPPAYPWVKTWPKASTGVPEPPPVAAPVPEAKVKAQSQEPLPDLPEIPQTKPTDTIVKDEMGVRGQQTEAGAKSADQPAEWSDDLMSLETPEEKRAARKKKKSPVPFILIGLMVLGAPVVYFLQNSGPSVEETPTPTPTLTATPTPAPAVATTPTPDVPVVTPLPAGNLSINGFNLDNGLREQEILAAGYKRLELFEENDKGVVRYTGPGGEIIANLRLPARTVTALQGSHLQIDGKSVADLSSSPERWEDDERFSKFKFQAVVDNEGKVRAFTKAAEGIYLTEPIIGSPRDALPLSRKIQDKKFFESIPAEIANMRLTDGNPFFFEFLDSFELDRLKFLINQGADPNLKSWADGSTALHECNNVKTARFLLENGADPTIENDEGLIPAQTATTEELRAVLSPANQAGASPTPAPSGTPASTVSPTPEATATPGDSPTPETSSTPEVSATPEASGSPTPAEAE